MLFTFGGGFGQVYHLLTLNFLVSVAGGLTGAKEGPLKARPEKWQRSRLLNRVHCSFASSSPIPDNLRPEHFKDCPSLLPFSSQRRPRIFTQQSCVMTATGDDLTLLLAVPRQP